MFGIKVKITKFVDDWQPGWVECEFTDGFGKLHIFNEKFQSSRQNILMKIVFIRKTELSDVKLSKEKM